MRSYFPRLKEITAGARTFLEQRDAFLADRFGALHFLKPVLDGEASAFFTNGNDERLQRTWARENGLRANSTLDDILLAQIEQHQTEIFYNLDPISYPSTFVKRLPGCVRKSIAWRAAPSGTVDFGAYDLIVCNFATIREGYKSRGWRTAHFFPAHDPEMDRYATAGDRPVDVLFVGGYSRHHLKRIEALESVARLHDRAEIAFHFDQSRLTRLAETPFGLIPALRKYRLSNHIRKVSRPPIFGRQLYQALGSARIVLNGSLDMAGIDRGNMRCWEAMGCGALLLSDSGNYPDGMVDGETMIVYTSPADLVKHIEALLREPRRLQQLSRNGHAMIKERYSKERQWQVFQELL